VSRCSRSGRGLPKYWREEGTLLVPQKCRERGLHSECSFARRKAKRWVCIGQGLFPEQKIPSLRGALLYVSLRSYAVLHAPFVLQIEIKEALISRTLYFHHTSTIPESTKVLSLSLMFSLILFVRCHAASYTVGIIEQCPRSPTCFRSQP